MKISLSKVLTSTLRSTQKIKIETANELLTNTNNDHTLDPSTHIDSEYARAGILDPKIVITTSRDPSSKLLQFAKEMRLVFPNSHRINRGNYVVRELAEACRANEVTDLIILHEHRGVPGASNLFNDFVLLDLG